MGSGQSSYNNYEKEYQESNIISKIGTIDKGDSFKSKYNQIHKKEILLHDKKQRERIILIDEIIDSANVEYAKRDEERWKRKFKTKKEKHPYSDIKKDYGNFEFHTDFIRPIVEKLTFEEILEILRFFTPKHFDKGINFDIDFNSIDTKDNMNYWKKYTESEEYGVQTQYDYLELFDCVRNEIRYRYLER